MDKPKIRFKGFTDEWEQRKLDDVVDFLDTLRKPLEGVKRVSGPYPYYGASGIVDYVDGYLFQEWQCQNLIRRHAKKSLFRVLYLKNRRKLRNLCCKICLFEELVRI